MADNDNGLSRRRFVYTSGAAAAMVGLAGCGGDGDGNGNGNGGNGDSGNGNGNGGNGTDTGNGNGNGGGNGETLNVLHGWTGSDGGQAADALFSTFQEQYPDIEVDEEPIGADGNQQLDTVVANRLQAGDPPSAFANWPGKNIQKYSGALGDVGDVWEEEDFEGAFVGEAAELHQTDGTFRAVPIGSHQLNCLFYHIPTVEEAGVDPEGLTDISAFMDALDAVDTETDKVPMTQVNAAWTINQMWASTLLGKEGYDAYMNFIEGNGDEEQVRSAFETMAEIHDNYIPADASSLNLTTSQENIINGDAAFIHNGNWSAGAFSNAEDFEYDEDWGYVPYPGTDGMYMLHFDSFLYPGDNPSPENSKTWMAYVGSEEAQVAYNQLKGSIPARTDADMSDFGPYLQDAAEEFANADQRPPNLQHGLGVTADVRTTLEDATTNNFTGPYDVDAVTSAFMDAV